MKQISKKAVIEKAIELAGVRLQHYMEQAARLDRSSPDQMAFLAMEKEGILPVGYRPASAAMAAACEASVEAVLAALADAGVIEGL